MGHELGDWCVLQHGQDMFQRHRVSLHLSVQRTGDGDAGGDKEAGAAGLDLLAQWDWPYPARTHSRKG